MRRSILRSVSGFYARAGPAKAFGARLLSVLAGLLYPDSCVHCERAGALLCDACIARCQRIGPRVCRRCSEPIPSALLCAGCAFRPLAVSTTLALFAYGGPVRDAVHALKYGDIRALAPVMGGMMAADQRLSALRFDAVVPVPLHRRRLRQRGYNQAELLAREIAKARSAQLDTSSLRRTAETPALARTESRVEREDSVRGAFTAARSVAGQSVLLVDDVTTTSATARECATALLAAGASEVNAIVFAKEV